MKLNTKRQNKVKNPKLKVINDNDVLTKPYNDINLKKWKEYPHILTNTLWEFKSRESTNGHSYDYHGNYIPQIANQLFERFTKKGDIILDLFFGSGTSGIEALNMKRRCIGVELKEDLIEHVKTKFSSRDLVTKMNIICSNSADKKTNDLIKARLEIMGENSAQFLVLHPPYDDIIKFSDKKEDLSNCKNTQEFYDLFEKVCKNGYDLLEKNRFCALIIGDKYSSGELIPLGFECMNRMNKVGFKTKSIIVKNIEGNEKAKGKTANLWRYRALNGGFYIFKHEYIIIFQKN